MTARGMKDTISKSNIFSRLLLSGSTELDLIVDEELTADDEEQDDARQYIGEGAVQTEGRGNLACAAVEHHQQQGHEDHDNGVEFRHPGHHNGGEAAAVHDGGGHGVVGAGGQQQTDQAAQCAGQGHGPDNDPVHLDTGIAGGAAALAHHGDLIALLAVVQINVHQTRHHGYHQNGQQILLVADGGQPAGLGVLVDDADHTESWCSCLIISLH